MIGPSTVMPPPRVYSPILTVPAVMLARSAEVTLNVPEVEPTEIDLVPLGRSWTALLPALTVPENEISLAVMSTMLAAIAVPPLLVTLPVPSVVMDRAPELVTLLLSVMEPLVPEDVVSVMLPPDDILPAVLILADAPVVVRLKEVDMVDVPSVTAPALVTYAAPNEPVVLTVRAEAAAV